jgi:hypothetical protein
MAMQFTDLKKLLDQKKLEYYEKPGRSEVMANFSELFGKHQIVIRLEVDGTFLQFRTLGFLECPKSHPSIGPVLEVIGELNYRMRLVKFGWDPSDGEIVAYADLWLEDNDVTLQQFDRMLGNYIFSIDLSRHRLAQTIETGEDPGEVSPAEIAERLKQVMAEKGGGDPMKKLLDKLLDGDEGKKEKKVVKI